jgi:TRAP-type uncharacterized transport system fused permease subunit
MSDIIWLAIPVGGLLLSIFVLNGPRRIIGIILVIICVVALYLDLTGSSISQLLGK